MVKALELGSPIKRWSILGPEDRCHRPTSLATALVAKHATAARTILISPDSDRPARDPGAVEYMAEHKYGARITIAEDRGMAARAVDGRRLDDGLGRRVWGLSYVMIQEFTRRYPEIKFEIIDLNFDSLVELPVPGKALARNNPAGTYAIPKTIQQCDRLISVASLKTHSITGVSLSMKNYFGIGPGAKYGFPKDGLHKLGNPDEVLIDLFSFHPADYAVVGGSWGVEADGPHAPGARSVHHNVLIAGANALSVDAVAAAVMGFKPADLPYLAMAERRGFGVADADVIWTRGNDIEEARRLFQKPAEWRKKA